MKRHRIKAFTLIELVIVVVIIGTIAAIAIPRLSRGSEGASDAALKQTLSVMRKAIEHYAAEHGGDYPDAPMEQLTMKSNADGATGAASTGKIYGPYLRELPVLDIAGVKGFPLIKIAAPGSTPDGTPAFMSWHYIEETGDIYANLADSKVDASGTPYNTY